MKLVVVLAALMISMSVIGKPLKVAFVYVSPVGDAGWTRSHDDARKSVERHFGEDVETHFVEGVAEGAASRKVITQLAEQGADMVFTTSWGYMVPTQRVASMFPDTRFEHATGLRRGDNLSTYANRAYEGRYLAGVLAGRTTKSNKIGYVAAFPVVEVIRGINAFTLGARSVNPEVEVHVKWTRSWYNPAKATQLADLLMDQGVDVMAQHTDSTAPLVAAEKRGVYAIGYHTDMSSFAPRYHLGSVIHDWSGIYKERIEALKNDRWQSKGIWPGLKEGAVDLVSLHSDVPQSTRNELNVIKGKLAANEQVIFKGPILNHKGRKKVRRGRTLSDDELIRMNWFVAGVKGNLVTF